MRQRIKYVFALLLILFSIFLSGCWDQKIFERIGFILQLGLEIDDTGKLKYSITLPVVSEDIPEKIEVLATTSDLLRESREKLRNLSGKRVEGGKIQHVHISKELAQKGIGDLLDIFLRNPEIPLLANVVVVDGSPSEMFEISKKYKDKPRVAFYVTQLIDDARKRTATPEARIFDFVIRQNSQTIDPIANYIGYSEKEIEVLGTALFNGDKMVGNIGIIETGLLHVLMGEKVDFQYYYIDEKANDEKEDGKTGIAITIDNVKRKVKTELKDGTPEIDINLELKGSLDEYKPNQHLDEIEVEKKLEGDIAKSLQQDFAELIKYLQEIRADPIGFGEIIRVKHNNYFKTIEWDKIYPEIKFKVDVKLDFEFYGAID